MGWFSNVFNPGKKYLKAAGRTLQNAHFKGGYMSGAGGLGAGFSFDKSGNLQSRMSLGEFEPFLQALLGSASDSFGRAGALDDLQGMMTSQAGTLGDIFKSSASIASQDPLERGQQITDLLRARRAGGAQNLVRDTFDRLFSSGGLANRSTRDDVTSEMSRQLSDEDLGFQLAGIQQGESSVMNAFARMMGAQQGQVSGLTGLENLRGMIQNQGMAAIGGAQSVANMPMQLMAMLAGLQGQRSQTELGIASGQLGQAKAAESTFLNFMNFLNGMQQQANQNMATAAMAG